MGTCGAYRRTSAAMHAFVGQIPQLGCCGDAFGVVAPPALQGAALEKNGGSDPRTVVNGKMLDIEKVTFHTALLPAAADRVFISRIPALIRINDAG